MKPLIGILAPNAGDSQYHSGFRVRLKQSGQDLTLRNLHALFESSYDEASLRDRAAYDSVAMPAAGYYLTGLLRANGYILRKIEAVVDFDFIYEEVEDRYGVNGNVSVPPPVILRLMVLLVFYNVRSERELMATLPERLNWLWFVGFDLDSEIPNHSVLSKAAHDGEMSRSGSSSNEQFDPVSKQAWSMGGRCSVTRAWFVPTRRRSRWWTDTRSSVI